MTALSLRRLVAGLRRLLAEVDLPEDNREEIEADLGVIEEEAATGQPRSQRIRPLLRRLQVALTGGAPAGAEAGAREEVIQLIDAVQRAITG